jgi:uncharacterized FlgJ-related protein
LFSFPSISIAKIGSQEFISSLLPEVSSAKKNVGGLAKNIPNSLIIAQAMLESGNGNSKLARKNNNLFGLKKGRNYGKFQSRSHCLEFYLRNYVSHKAYLEFRESIKGGVKDSIKLLSFLDSYAEDKSYKDLITGVILKNNLKYYDV